MRLETEQARARFSSARIARLATVDDEYPHLVPITFAVHGDTVVTASDRRPRHAEQLRRLAGIIANPRVALLADEHDDDCSPLWWARADGVAHVEHDGEERSAALDLLAERYPQYRDDRPDGPVILIGVARWSGWSAR
ncbi:TIGR03668 family PPOX class F420-dependent oxidoreductase [Actinorugispora endophytica]|uniref:PPOX class probable F420-dependent enzyme n=1 Tax=Actinorugispora endophytica TaxID=1605990 RepID=A0A4R6UXI9_9ACTN|nr:TIGR03668 family PPOX class F420-dependent oxidoreductase [Actinorugispora endophytica]TDQ52177.1 PPOX class probable F420-dependent enzyme [Actinorugispora endophytica]